MSIVSGTAIAEAPRRRGPRRPQVLIDLDGRWWWLPADHRRERRPAAAYDDPAALGGDGPAAGRRRDRPPRRARPAAGRLHRPARSVRRGRHGPGAARGGRPRLHRVRRGGLGARHGQGRSSSGSARGLGLPVVDWREVRAGALAATGPPCSASSRRSPRAPADPRLMVKPARLGSSVGMTLAHAAGERGGRARGGLPLRRRWRSSRRYSPAPATSRSASSATTAARAVRPGRDRRRPRVLRLRREVHAGLSETSTHAEVPDAMRERRC